MGRHKKDLNREPTEAELKAAERYAKKLEKRAQADIDEIRKSLVVDEYNDEEDLT